MSFKEHHQILMENRNNLQIIKEDIKSIAKALTNMINDFEDGNDDSKNSNKKYEEMSKKDLALILAYIQYYIKHHDDRDKASVGINTFLKSNEEIVNAIEKSLNTLRSAKIQVNSLFSALNNVINDLERDLHKKQKQEDIELLKTKLEQLKTYFRNSSLHVVFKD